MSIEIAPDTRSAIIEMMCQDTGRAMCDSGGTPEYDADGKYVKSTSGYGRQFERNRGRDFDSEPVAAVSFYAGKSGELSIEYTYSTYHYLNKALELDPVLDTVFKHFAVQACDADDPWLVIMEHFVEHGRLFDFLSLEAPMGELSEDAYVILDALKASRGRLDYHSTTNTYNGESLLDQTLQYVEFGIDGVDYVVLQTHNGCDVRGGYSTPRVFRKNDDVIFSPVPVGSIWSSVRYAVGWQSEDGWNWEYTGPDDEKTPGAKLPLRKYKAVALDSLREIAELAPILDALYRSDREVAAFVANRPEAEERIRADVEKRKTKLMKELVTGAAMSSDRDGIVVVNNDTGEGYCPLTGGKLVTYS